MIYINIYLIIYIDTFNCRYLIIEQNESNRTSCSNYKYITYILIGLGLQYNFHYHTILHQFSRLVCHILK